MENRDLTLIVGGTGKTGRRVAECLAARELPHRVASRSGTPGFDWADEASWPELLDGARRVYLTYYPDLALPGASIAIRRFSERAVAAGVRKIVLLSGRGEPQVLASEQAVVESGASFTILRSAFFCQNFSEGQMLAPVLEGELAFPAGSVAEPFIDADDIAEVALAALTDDQHAGKIYDLTGPGLVTFEQAMRDISAATGRTIRYTPVSKQQYAASLAPFLPAELVQFLSELFTFVLDGHNAHLSDGVERVLGRPPRDFSAWARAAAAQGAWSA